jgi:hypothetical protein
MRPERNTRILMKFKGSSCLKAAWYNRSNLQLTVEFREGSKTRFQLVPWQVAAALLGADSPGSYFNYMIKDRFPNMR